MTPNNIDKETVLALRQANFNKQLISELDVNLQSSSGVFLPNNSPDFKNISFYNKEMSEAYLDYSTATIKPILNSF